MSACGQTEEDGAPEEMGAPVRDIYEQKAVSKVVRVLTVLAYLLSVSLAAILLSVYYVCVWKSPALPPELPPPNDTLHASRHRADAVEFHDPGSPFDDGGSNTTVSENVTQALANITEMFLNATEAAEGSGDDPADPANAPRAAYAAPSEGSGGDDPGVT